MSLTFFSSFVNAVREVYCVSSNLFEYHPLIFVVFRMPLLFCSQFLSCFSYEIHVSISAVCSIYFITCSYFFIYVLLLLLGLINERFFLFLVRLFWSRFLIFSGIFSSQCILDVFRVNFRAY